jgi:hypothetical protein
VQRRVLYLVVVTTVAIAAGCGGDEDDQGDVLADAGSICREGTSEAEEFAQSNALPTAPDEVNGALEAEQQIARRVASRLERLEAPDEGGDFEDFVSTQRRSASLYGDQIAASEAGDPAAFGAASERLLAEFESAKRSATAAGIADCPYTPISVVYAEGGPDGQAAAVGGTWTGPVTQYGPGSRTSRYPVEIAITDDTPGAVAGTIAYPTLPCAGELRLSRASAPRYVFRERIVSGRGRCFDGGTVSVAVSGSEMTWRWVGSGAEALGRLVREP